MLTTQAVRRQLDEELEYGFKFIDSLAADGSSIFYTGKSDIVKHVARNLRGTLLEDTGRKLLQTVIQSANLGYNPYLEAYADPLTIALDASVIATYEPNDPFVGSAVAQLGKLVTNGKPRMPAIYARQEPFSAALNVIDLFFLLTRIDDRLFRQTTDFIFSRRYRNGVFKGYYGNGAVWYNARHGKLRLALKEYLYCSGVKRDAFDQETNAAVCKTFTPKKLDADPRIKPAIETVRKFLLAGEYPYAQRYPNVDVGIAHAILATDPNMQIEDLPAKKQKTLTKILAEREVPTLERKLHRINQLIQLKKTLSSRV